MSFLIRNFLKFLEVIQKQLLAKIGKHLNLGLYSLWELTILTDKAVVMSSGSW